MSCAVSICRAMALSDARRSPDVAVWTILPSAAEVVLFGLPGLGSSERPVERPRRTIVVLSRCCNETCVPVAGDSFLAA